MVLDLGAGLASTNFPNVVQLEMRKYAGTDIVITSQDLPFKDDTFDGVISQAVIEHVPDPAKHVQEIFRVLRPGGRVVLDAAFLQPLHGAPYHYYNMTKFAVLDLFSAFEETNIEVAPYHYPWVALRWYLRSYTQALATEADRDEFSNLKVKEILSRAAAVDRRRIEYRSLEQRSPRELASWGQSMNDVCKEELGCLRSVTSAGNDELAAGFRIVASKPHSATSARRWWQR